VGRGGYRDLCGVAETPGEVVEGSQGVPVTSDIRMTGAERPGSRRAQGQEP
jgi:hypothetical protein